MTAYSVVSLYAEAQRKAITRAKYVLKRKVPPMLYPSTFDKSVASRISSLLKRKQGLTDANNLLLKT